MFHGKALRQHTSFTSTPRNKEESDTSTLRSSHLKSKLHLYAKQLWDVEQLHFSPQDSFTHALLLVIALLFTDLIAACLIILGFTVLPDLRRFGGILTCRIHVLVASGLRLRSNARLIIPPTFHQRVCHRLKVSLCSGRTTRRTNLH